MRFLVLGLTLIVSLLVIKRVSAHGRLIEPPSRASMWRYGFDTPHDYNDHAGNGNGTKGNAASAATLGILQR